MIFFFDNNLSPNIAKGLKEFGENTTYLKEHLPENIKDVELFEYLYNNKMILITRDNNIRYNQAEKQAIYKYEVGVFILSGKNLNGWKIILQIVINWENIKNLSSKTNKPFAYRIPPNGKNITKISL